MYVTAKTDYVYNILGFIDNGYTNEDICNKLGISDTQLCRIKKLFGKYTSEKEPTLQGTYKLLYRQFETMINRGAKITDIAYTLNISEEDTIQLCKRFDFGAKGIWTDKNKKRLIELYDFKLSNEIALIFDVEKDEIRREIDKLGLRNKFSYGTVIRLLKIGTKPADIAKKFPGQTEQSVNDIIEQIDKSRDKCKYSDLEEETLRKLADCHCSLKEIMQQFNNRDANSIHRKLISLGYRRYTKDNDVYYCIDRKLGEKINNPVQEKQVKPVINNIQEVNKSSVDELDRSSNLSNVIAVKQKQPKNGMNIDNAYGIAHYLLNGINKNKYNNINVNMKADQSIMELILSK